MSAAAVTYLFVMGGGGSALLIIGRRHGRRAQVLPFPLLLVMVAMACGPILLAGPPAIPWVVPLATYMIGQWAGVQPRALLVRRGRAQRKRMFRELRAGNIEFYFQPIIDQFKGMVVGCEALARWRNAGGIEGPGPWLDAIEADPALAELFNEQLCASACLFANQWPQVRVSLNTMPERMAEPGWAQRSVDRILEHSSNPQQFTYEVLEGTLLRAEPAVYENLRVLRAAGCHVALDDFGEGLANVMRFMSFASCIDTIKIDQKLIQNDDRRGANCLIRLAQDYSVTVVAEGVETSAQLAWLGSTGVSHVQGWVFSKALPPVEAGQFIRRLESAPEVADSRSHRRAADWTPSAERNDVLSAATCLHPEAHDVVSAQVRLRGCRYWTYGSMRRLRSPVSHAQATVGSLRRYPTRVGPRLGASATTTQVATRSPSFVWKTTLTRSPAMARIRRRCVVSTTVASASTPSRRSRAAPPGRDVRSRVQPRPG